jgi:hypothetical protein
LEEQGRKYRQTQIILTCSEESGQTSAGSAKKGKRHLGWLDRLALAVSWILSVIAGYDNCIAKSM